jgi:hypothetical protein
MQFLFNLGYYASILFNTMFAILSTVTLLGIVFITKPQKVMHNVPPEWWIPLTLIIVPAQLFCQYLIWKTVLRKQIPTPLAISQNLVAPPAFLRYPLAMLWAANFLIGFVIVVSLFKPNPGRNIEWPLVLLVAFITFSLTTIANVYWMLLIRTITDEEKWLKLAWHFRFVVDLAITVTAVIYYKIWF